MSRQRIQHYHSEIERLIQYGGSRNETSIRSAFMRLLEHYAQSKNLVLVPELEYATSLNTKVYPDGTLKNAVRQDLGYWESKDEQDDLDAEIALKFARGYPKTNILFEDSSTVVLFQNGLEAGRSATSDYNTLHALLEQFVSYEPAYVRTFREAVNRFQEDLPDLLDNLRTVIENQTSPAFVQKRDHLLDLAQKAINPHLTSADIREMVIQHILTEEIFLSVFNESQFHRENNIARELHNVTDTFFTGALKRNTLSRIEPYYAVIRAAAQGIADHHEKQQFLKVIYENFYKAYNPAGADRLGIVYTPNEIVRFMIEGAEHLVHRHFGKLLGDEDVNILDPATGTGTFITELIEYLPRQQLKRKYQHELFCNEVALLPYYTANLNIEYTYQQKMGEYVEFENIAFVDTLENLDYVGSTGQFGIFELTAENLERIRRQNEKKISVIIGNPPYNANQLNENENNKNRPYPSVDDRIKQTYVRESTAQKTKVYDMYSRFIRWASDRIGQNGVVAYIVNRSFIDSRTFDGFRKVVADEFSDIYVVDLGGDVRANPKLSGTTHNVFGIQTGVAMVFFVRKEGRTQAADIFYARRPEMETAKEKLSWLRDAKLEHVPFTHITPDRRNNWINQSENAWDELVPTASKETKFSRDDSEFNALFRIYSPGIVTARDEWIVDASIKSLKEKMGYFISFFNNYDKVGDFDTTIKWSRNLKSRYDRNLKESFDEARIKRYSYRPFCNDYLYHSTIFIDENGLSQELFSNQNKVIAFTNPASPKPFHVLATQNLVDFHLTGDTQYLPLYRYDKSGNRLENITDWGLAQFRAQYRDAGISKLDIFHYVYGVLHDPAYREKYRLNLKREFPRIPFYEEFGQWAAWGKDLMGLHLNYETAEPYPLERVDAANVANPKAKLTADKARGQIILDTGTVLSGVPAAAWDYKLGNRSALEWVLDRYKEKTPRDPTIRAKFNTYHFADYKEQVIELLKRVCTVSVGTVAVVSKMEGS